MRSPRRATIERRDVYPRAVVDGRELSGGLPGRLRRRVDGLLVSKGEREEARTEGLIRSQPGVTRPNTIAVISPKGGVGKTTSTFLIGNLLATHLKLRVIAVDANPDFGTLGALAPDGLRSRRSLADLAADSERLHTAAELRAYVSQVPSGLHLLAAPSDPERMAEMTPELYGSLLSYLAVFYDVVLLDLGTGITDPLARFGIERSDQVVVITTPEWVTAATVLGALEQLPAHDRATVVLNKAKLKGAGEREGIEQRFREVRLHRTVTVPFDEQLQTMLDSGTYALEALDRQTRLPIKLLGLSVAEQLV